jgi:hypothetical protein
MLIRTILTFTTVTRIGSFQRKLDGSFTRPLTGPENRALLRLVSS